MLIASSACHDRQQRNVRRLHPLAVLRAKMPVLRFQFTCPLRRLGRSALSRGLQARAGLGGGEHLTSPRVGEVARSAGGRGPRCSPSRSPPTKLSGSPLTPSPPPQGGGESGQFDFLWRRHALADETRNRRGDPQSHRQAVDHRRKRGDNARGQSGQRGSRTLQRLSRSGRQPRLHGLAIPARRRAEKARAHSHGRRS